MYCRVVVSRGSVEGATSQTKEPKNAMKEEEEDDDEIEILHEKLVTRGAAPMEKTPAIAHRKRSFPPPSPVCTIDNSQAIAPRERALPPHSIDASLLHSMRQHVTSVAAITRDEPQLAVDEPSCTVDKDYWSCRSIGVSCPRCGIRLSHMQQTRALHYKKHHYNIYFPLVHKPWWTTLDRFVGTYFGDAKGPRECVKCVRDGQKYTSHRGRMELALHIKQMHHNDFILLSTHYTTLPQSAAPSYEELHPLLMNHPPFHLPIPLPLLIPSVDILAEAVSDANAVSAAIAAACTSNVDATPSITTDAPRSAADEEYWRGNVSMTVCPRGCYYIGERAEGRRCHYKRHHYNIYYNDGLGYAHGGALVTDRWMYMHFGENNTNCRVCIHCAGDRRHWSDYRSRAELAKHMQTEHSKDFIEMTLEYYRIFKGQIKDAQVHPILMSSVMVCRQ